MFPLLKSSHSTVTDKIDRQTDGHTDNIDVIPISQPAYTEPVFTDDSSLNMRLRKSDFKKAL